MRKRAPENDYICLRCGCPCDHQRHLGGGQGMKACGKPPNPILRSTYEAEIQAIVDLIRER